MKFQVYQDGIPADSNSRQYIKNGKGWDNSVFDTFEEANIYAVLWARPYDLQMAQVASKNYLKMEINSPIDMSYCEFPIMMEIREVK